MREGDRSNCGKAALVNKVVSALMSGLPFKTSFKNGVELVKGFLDAAIDLVPARPFSNDVIVKPSFIFRVSSDWK